MAKKDTKNTKGAGKTGILSNWIVRNLLLAALVVVGLLLVAQVGLSLVTRHNRTVPVPVFYSGGEQSHLPELPFQAETCLERVQYVAEVNRLRKPFGGVSFARKDGWEDPVWGVPGDRVEKIFDPSRGSTLTVHYYDSEDGVCRTAFASVSGQIHECRHHSCENAWKFISQFRRP